MLATLILLTCLTFDTCTSCSVLGRDVKLCEPHATQELAAFAREANGLGSKDSAARTAALDALAALTQAHTNAPSARVAKRLGSALEDDSIAVREHAAGLLAPPQHALVSLEALLEAVGNMKKERAQLHAAYEATSKKLAGKHSVARKAELAQELQAAMERLQSCDQWHRTLVERLGSFPDDRAVDAILAHTQRNLLIRSEEALVRLGNRKAIRALIESFDACDRDLAKAEKDVAEREKASANQPKTLGDALYGIALDKMREASRQSREALAKRFAEKGLTAPDPGASSGAWKKWIEENLQAFPVSLPGLTSPAW